MRSKSFGSINLILIIFDGILFIVLVVVLVMMLNYKARVDEYAEKLDFAKIQVVELTEALDQFKQIHKYSSAMTQHVSKQNKVAPIVIAKIPIKKGSIILQNQLQLATWNSKALPHHYVDNISKLAGTSATTNISAGEPVLLHY